MIVKAIYDNNVIRPLEKLDLKEGTEIEVEIIESNTDRIVGLLRDIDIDSVDLQHRAKDLWVKKVVSD